MKIDKGAHLGKCLFCMEEKMKWLTNDAIVCKDGQCGQCSGLCKQGELFPETLKRPSWWQRVVSFFKRWIK